MKHKITKDNFFISSIADFKRVNNVPEREPDYTAYKTFIAWEHEVWDVDEDENGEVIRVHFDVEDLEDEWGYDIVSYDVVDTFIGKYGDTGYRCLSKSSISSRYWYTEEGVYRKSNHWGKCRDCYWTIDGEESDEEMIGFCRWEDFRDDDFPPLTDEEKPCEKGMLRGVIITQEGDSTAL